MRCGIPGRYFHPIYSRKCGNRNELHGLHKVDKPTFVYISEGQMQEDIKNASQIKELVNAFYDKVRTDSVIGYIFNNIIGSDWSHHLPIMYRFWASVLLQQPGYLGNPVKKHIDIDQKMPLKDEHYKRWLELWNETVDAMFAGPVADEAKNRAALMLNLINIKVTMARDGKAIQ